MLLGYALAVQVAASITVFIIFIPTVLPDNGAWGPANKTLQDIVPLLLFGTVYTVIYALPGWLISVIAAEWRNKRCKIWFAIAGFLTAVLAQLIAYAFLGGLFAEPLTLIGSLTGGFFGGLTYRAVAGKRSGAWKSTP